jgi:hypothetical protein
MAAAPAAARKPSGKARTERNARALERAREGGAATATRTRGAAAPARKSRPAPAAPRRKSGPAHRSYPQRTSAPRTIARPLARAAQGSAALVLDRLLRGRGWVVLVGALLAGIVFLNVSVLELNRGIAKTSTSAAALERSNSTLRARVADLDSAERIQKAAEARGFILPQPGDVTYVRAHSRDAELAAERIEPPASGGTDVAAPATPTDPYTATAPTTQTTAVPSATTTTMPTTPAAPAATSTEPSTATAPATTSTTASVTPTTTPTQATP